MFASKTVLSSVICGAALALTPAARAAVLVDFNGYADGEIVGQPTGAPAGTTAWTGAGGQFAVETGGSSGKRLVTTTGAVANSTVGYIPTRAELGAPATGLTELQSFSFRYSVLSAGTASTNAVRVFVGAAGASNSYGIDIVLRSGSVLTKGSTVTLASGLTSGSEYVISGTLDYANATYSIAVADTAGTSLGSRTNVAFDGTVVPTNYGGVRFNTRTDGATARVAVDDVALSVVPEPSALALAGLGAIALLRRKR
jgi:MYXO-CTERM domain-containing protein